MHTRLAFSLFVFGFLFVLPVSAQTAPALSKLPEEIQTLLKKDPNTLSDEEKEKIRAALPAPSLGEPVAPPEGSVNCFDDYKFGSVQVDLSPTLAQTIPGAPLTFTGKLKNDNSYPIIQGSVFVKIFKKEGEDSKIHQNGYPMVAFFEAGKDIAIPAKSEKDFSFSYDVPGNLSGGDYEADFFFVTNDRFNLLGLSFTDDVTGNKASFAITPPNRNQAVFNKHTVTLNKETYRFAAFPPHFTKDEPVTATVELANPSNETKTIALKWTLFNWDGLRDDNRLDEKTELITLKGKETKSLSYTTTKQRGSVSYLLAEAKDKDASSILNIRFVRDGIPEMRLNFPSITNFPIEKGKENAIFSCVHSTNLPKIDGNEIILTLIDADTGETLHTYTYEGAVTGAMMGVKQSFTPSKTTGNVNLTTILKNNGKTIDTVTQTYRCEEIDPSLCPESKNNEKGGMSKESRNKGLLYGLITLLSIGGIFFVIWKAMKGRNGNGPTPPTSTGGFRRMVMFFLVLSAGLLVGGEAEAKNVVWVSPSMGFRFGSIDPTYWNVQASVLYGASLQQGVTILNDGDSIPVGSVFSVIPKNYENTDIQWTVTGEGWDTPYGHWVSNANPPLYDPSTFDYYYLSVNPPTPRFVFTGPVSCNGNSCTVTGAGSISVAVQFPITQGKFWKYFYNRFSRTYYSLNQDVMYGYWFDSAGNNINDGCSYSGDCWLGDYPYFHSTETGLDYTWGFGAPTHESMNVPLQTITFNLTAISTNNNPNPPATTPQPFSGNTNTSYPFTFQGTDPDNDQIRYAIDWNNDGLVDEYAPSTGYVASGTTKTASNPIALWPAANTYTFRVRTEDNKGGFSSWSTPQVTVAPVINGSCGPASGLSLDSLTTTSPGLCGTGTLTGNALTPTSSGWTWGCSGSSRGTSTLPNACSATQNKYTLTGQTSCLNCASLSATVSWVDATSTTKTGGLITESNIPSGQIRTITTTAVGPYTFQSFSGCDSPSSTTCTQTINTNETVTAQYTHNPENGSCGSANGGSFESLSGTSPGLCSAGAPATFSLSGQTYSWSCNGLYGSAANASCSAHQERNFNWQETSP